MSGIERSIDGEHFVRLIATERGTCAEKVRCERRDHLPKRCENLAVAMKSWRGRFMFVCAEHKSSEVASA